MDRKGIIKHGMKMIDARPLSSFKDSDGDKVANILDCKPYDKNKQGWIHDKYKEWKQKRAYRQAAEQQIKEKAQAEYYREKETQEKRFVREKAKADVDQRIKKYKQRQTQGGSGFVGQFMSGFSKPTAKKTTAKPTYKYVKKGKHYVRKKVGTTKTTARSKPIMPRESLQDYMNKRFQF